MRVSTPPTKSYSFFSRFMFWRQKKTMGRILEATLLWGRSSWLYLTFSAMYGAISRRSSPLEKSLIYLINTRVAQLNHCPFCVDLNSSILQKHNVPYDKILDLPNFQNSHHFTEHEKVALLYAEAVTRNLQDTYDAIVQDLKEYFSDDDIIEITAVIAFENMSSKFNAALGVASQGFCKMPGKDNAS